MIRRHKETDAKFRLRRSISIGLTSTSIVAFLVIVSDLFSPVVELPMLSRNPVAWLYYWPTWIWNAPGTRVGNFDTVASLLINVIAYSLIAYAVQILRK